MIVCIYVVYIYVVYIYVYVCAGIRMGSRRTRYGEPSSTGCAGTSSWILFVKAGVSNDQFNYLPILNSRGGVTIDLLAMASVFVGYVLVDEVAKDTQNRKLAAMRWSGQIW